MKVEILVKVIKGDGVSGCGRFMPFWKIGNPSFTPLNQGPDRFVAVGHAISADARRSHPCGRTRSEHGEDRERCVKEICLKTR